MDSMDLAVYEKGTSLDPANAISGRYNNWNWTHDFGVCPPVNRSNHFPIANRTLAIWHIVFNLLNPYFLLVALFLGAVSIKNGLMAHPMLSSFEMGETALFLLLLELIQLSFRHYFYFKRTLLFFVVMTLFLFGYIGLPLSGYFALNSIVSFGVVFLLLVIMNRMSYRIVLASFKLDYN